MSKLEQIFSNIYRIPTSTFMNVENVGNSYYSNVFRPCFIHVESCTVASTQRWEKEKKANGYRKKKAQT